MTNIKKRKADHIEIALNEDVTMSRSTGLEHRHFSHQALPEIALEDISLATNFLGHDIAAPLLISSMTGGSTYGETINRHLGEAAQALQIPMGVGSQRIMLEQPDVLSSFKSARDAAPDISIFGNMGIAQLNDGVGASDIRYVVEAIGANGCFLHMNPLQEAVQPSGDSNFRELLDQIGSLVEQVDFPILAKEVGCGISPEISKSLADRGVTAIDVSGAGGTSWAKIESLRTDDPVQQRLGDVFKNWGIPTADALISNRRVLPDLPLIASGGIRTGLDVAKAIALGADTAAFAMPLLQPALQSAQAVIRTIEQILQELRVTMFLVGAKDIPDLKASRHLLQEESWSSLQDSQSQSGCQS